MTLSFAFFIITGTVLSVIDFKKHIIPDAIVLPSIAILALLKFYETADISNYLIAIVVIVAVFLAILYFFTDFGGGDIRFGIFCALFLGFPDIFVFFIIAGMLHLIILIIFKRKIMGFAPAMFIAAVTTKLFAATIWSLI